MSPSPDAVAAIRARVAELGLDAARPADVARALNTPDRPNPAAPPPPVPAPLDPDALLGSLAPESAARLFANPNLGRFLDDLHAGDRDRVRRWAALAVQAGAIGRAEGAALAAACDATTPDPSHRAEVSWAEAIVGRPVDADDVAAALAGE